MHFTRALAACQEKNEGGINSSVMGFPTEGIMDGSAAGSRVHDLEFMIGEFAVTWDGTFKGCPFRIS